MPFFAKQWFLGPGLWLSQWRGLPLTLPFRAVDVWIPAGDQPCPLGPSAPISVCPDLGVIRVSPGCLPLPSGSPGLGSFLVFFAFTDGTSHGATSLAGNPER